MIDVKQAVMLARQYLTDMLSPEPLSDLRLEEVEIEDDGFWYVTLGFNRATSKSNSAIMQQLHESRREYKILKIDRDTGDIRAMKMRTPA